MPRSRRLFGLLAMLSLCTCDSASCWWTDGPPPRDPYAVHHQAGRRYESADGTFEFVLHADGSWPLVVGTSSVRIEWSATMSPSDGVPRMSAERPYLAEGDLDAASDPTVVELEPNMWRIEQLELDAPGTWVVPVSFELGTLTDSVELAIDVAEDDG